MNEPLKAHNHFYSWPIFRWLFGELIGQGYEIFKHALSPADRFIAWMWGTSVFGKKDGGFSQGFPPFLALTSLDDTDTLVRDTYFEWLKERRKHPENEPDNKSYATSCFASAVAVILGAGTTEEEELVRLLNERYDELETDDLPLIQQNCTESKDPDERKKCPIHAEITWAPALDFMVGLALAWTHAKRRADAGQPITTKDFPQIPQNIAFWPEPKVPLPVFEAARDNNENIVIPIEVIQGTKTPIIDRDGVALFLSSNPPVKSPIPDPIVPPLPTLLILEKTYLVSDADREVYTNIALEPGDEFEIEASGLIWAGDLTIGENGPNGLKTIETDARFPLHKALDPINSHPFALIARLHGGYFFVGEHRQRERFLYYRPSPIWLRINDPVPGNGSGQFEVKIRVWGQPRKLPSLQVTGIKKRNRKIESICAFHEHQWPCYIKLEKAVEAIEEGHALYIKDTDGKITPIIVATSRKGNKYLRTVPGGGASNNLGSLPICQI